MRPDKMLLTVASAVALAAGAFLSYPVAAATAGFHGAYFSESSFLSLTPGQTGQFSVGFSNTGDQAWVKSTVGQAVSLHTAAPLDNATDSAAGWASGWAAPNIYANQLSDLVAPAQVGFFVYNVAVPAAAALGAHTFYGRPVIDGVGPLEDYGYYQIATIVSSTYTLAITGTTPATPSTTSNPTVTGNGAPPSTTVTILDGTTNVGSVTSGSDGTFSIAVNNALAVGAHSLTATATGATTSAIYTYTVVAASTVTTTTSGSLTLSWPGTYSTIVTFSKAINSGPVTAANYKWDSAAFPTAPTLQTGSLAVRLDFPSTALPAAGTHTLDIYSQTFQDATVFSPNPTSFTVVVSTDATSPTLSGVSAVAAAAIDVTFSEAMRSSAASYFATTNAIDSTARYTLTNPDGSAATTGGSTGSGTAITVTAATTGGTSTDAALYNETKARLTLSANLNSAITYTLTATMFADQAGNTVTTASTTFVYSGASVLPVVSSVTATQLQLTVTYSKAMSHLAVANATATVCAGTGTQIDNKSNYTLGTTMGTALANAATTCFISSDERTVTFTFTPATGLVQGSYTYSINGVSDNISTANVVALTASSVTAANSAPKLASATYLSANGFSVTFSEAMSITATTDAGSATNPNNYSVNGGTGGTGNGTYGDLCVTGGTASISASNSNKTFTILCTGANGKWGTASTALQVYRVIDSDAGSLLDPSPSATAF